MPIQRGNDSHGSFYRWGTTGHKYYYKTNNSRSRENAKEKARRQGIAVKISQSRRYN